MLFDFVFIDVDKFSNLIYFDVVLWLIGIGVVIIIDNVVCNGVVMVIDSDDLCVWGV